MSGQPTAAEPVQASPINWMSSPHLLRCRACDWQGEGELIAEVTALGQHRLPAVRCTQCGSIEFLDEPLDTSPTDESVDGYVEAGAGIGSIAEALQLVDPTSVTRFLDVGCNYGFALDLGHFLYGWDVVGVEPSHAGTRGSAELGVDIRPEYLTDDSNVGADFDLILASEVVEHVPDPVGFLVALRNRLSVSGSVVLTTPAAEIVSPDNPESEVLGAVSAGFHVFIASEQGLKTLLRRAGFTEVRVERRRGNLRAVARLQAFPRAAAPVGQPALDGYYLARAQSAAAGSALSLGMATRALRTLVSTGRYQEAETAVTLVAEAFSARYGIDFDDPRAASDQLETSSHGSWVLTGAAFARGILDLLYYLRPERSAAFFSLAARSAEVWTRSAGVADLDTVDLRFQAPYHRLLALAQIDGASAAEEAMLLGRDPDYRAPADRRRTDLAQCRVFTSIVANGTHLPGSALATVVAETAPGLASSAELDERTAGLDALYSLGVAYFHAGDFPLARHWLATCRGLCRSGPRAGEHRRRLAKLCSAMLATMGRPPKGASRRRTSLQTESVVDVSSMRFHIDAYWCDAAGMYLAGWAHLDAQVIERISVMVGDSSVPAIRHDRLDLLQFWPATPEVVRGGFSAYVPGRPSGDVELLAHTRDGIVAQPIDLPDHPLPIQDAHPSMSEITERLAAFVESAPAGPVLAIGIRAATEAMLALQLEIFRGREVIGLDIHPGIGVDMVGDAHRLSKLFPRDHFAVVYSASLLEHVAAPWIVAAECARVLQIGGLAIHNTPWIWPTHAAPSDFWRMSPEGLSQLFSRQLGFEPRLTSGSGGAVVLPAPDWRLAGLTMPTTSSASGSWIVAEKVDDSAVDVTWPYLEDSGLVIAQQYPVIGLASWGSSDA